MRKKSKPVSPIARTRGCAANFSMIAKSFSRSATTGASLGCNATAARTESGKLSAHSTHHCDCSAEYPTCTMRSTPTERASLITFATSGELGAVFVTISICACESTTRLFSGSGSGPGCLSISRLWRSAIDYFASPSSSRGKRTAPLVTVLPAGSCPHRATEEIR